MSTDITNMQISGIPVIMYGMIGITTAVLAFVTLNSGGLVTDGQEESVKQESVETPVETPAADVSSETPVEESTENVQQGGKKKRGKSKKNKSKSKCSKKHRHTKKCK